MRRFIPVSWLGTLHYCPYQLYLREVLGMRPAPSPAMTAGLKRHQQLEATHLAEATEELTVEEALYRSVAEKTAFTFRELMLTSDTHKLRGLADEITFFPDNVVVVDDKPAVRVWPADIAQTRGYCLALQDAYSPDRPLFAVVRNRDSGVEVWRGEFDVKAREAAVNDVDRLWGMLRGEFPWEDGASSSKCRACRYRQWCERCEK